MNQSKLLAITSNMLKAWEKLHKQGATGFSFASHGMKNTLKPF